MEPAEEFALQRPHFPARVTVYEVGPRDGLQNEAETLPVDVRVEYVDRLTEAGLPAIEVGSFVSPRAIPQLADTEEVFARIHRASGTRYPALVPNLVGLERAMAAGVREIAVFTAASETFNRHNINAGVDESIERFRPVVARAREEKIRVRGYVSTAFGCPYEGPVSPDAVREVVHKLLDLPVDEISIGDTIGVATPAGVYDVVETLYDSGVTRGRPRAALPRHARHRPRQRLCRAAMRDHDLRLLGRGAGRLPLRSRRGRQPGDRGPDLSPGRPEHRDGSEPPQGRGRVALSRTGPRTAPARAATSPPSGDRTR